MLKWITILALMAVPVFADIVPIASGLSGRIIETRHGYRGDNGYTVRTSTGYRTTLRDGRIVVATRTAQGWRISTVGGSGSTRSYFHR